MFAFVRKICHKLIKGFEVRIEWYVPHILSLWRWCLEVNEKSSGFLSSVASEQANLSTSSCLFCMYSTREAADSLHVRATGDGNLKSSLSMTVLTRASNVEKGSA